MKTEIQEYIAPPPPPPTGPMFPALFCLNGIDATGPSTGAVVLFTGECEGTVVFAPEGSRLRVGEFEQGFIECTKTNFWNRLPKDQQVILRNE